MDAGYYIIEILWNNQIKLSNIYWNKKKRNAYFLLVDICSKDALLT